MLIGTREGTTLGAGTTIFFVTAAVRAWFDKTLISETRDPELKPVDMLAATCRALERLRLLRFKASLAMLNDVDDRLERGPDMSIGTDVWERGGILFIGVCIYIVLDRPVLGQA
jgi:hypothetical protein